MCAIAALHSMTAMAATSGRAVRDCAENVNMSSGRMRLGRTRCYRTLAAVLTAQNPRKVHSRQSPVSSQFTVIF